MSGSRKNSALASKIKRMMQADEDVGKISQQTPTVIAHAMELFLEQLAKGSAAIATARADKTLMTAHLKVFVNSNPDMDFLKDIVSKAPDLKEKVATSGSKQQRAKSGEGTAKPKRKSKAMQETEGAKTPTKRNKKSEDAAVKVETAADGNEQRAALADQAGTKHDPDDTEGAQEIKTEATGKDPDTGATGSLKKEEGVVGVQSGAGPEEGNAGDIDKVTMSKDIPATARRVAAIEEEEDDYDDL